MMKKYGYLLMMLLCVAVFPSCKDDDGEDTAEKYKEWREENEAFILKIKNSGEYSELDIPSRMGKIYVKVLKEGDGKEPIHYNTTTVKAYYKGTFINDEVFASALYPDSDPAELAPNGVIDGFGAALQYMKVGDKWAFWLPWQIAYGATGRSNDNYSTYVVLPYSALYYEVEILEIVKEES